MPEVIDLEPIYKWLYDHYAQPRLGRLPPFQDKRVRDALAGETELERLDRVYALVLDCATAAFETGVRLGLALTAPDRP